MNLKELREVIAASGQLRLKAIGDSMQGVIAPGETLNIVKIEDPQSLRRFDIVLFEREEKIICHYFWEFNKVFTDIENPTLVTRPTNPILAYDHPIQSSALLGLIVNFKMSFAMKTKIVLLTLFKKYNS